MATARKKSLKLLVSITLLFKESFAKNKHVNNVYTVVAFQVIDKKKQYFLSLPFLFSEALILFVINGGRSENSCFLLQGKKTCVLTRLDHSATYIVSVSTVAEYDTSIPIEDSASTCELLKFAITVVLLNSLFASDLIRVPRYLSAANQTTELLFFNKFWKWQ